MTDRAWLVPLCDAGIVRLPQADQIWSVTALTNGLGRTEPEAVADLLLRLMGDAEPGTSRDRTYLEALRMAAYLGDAGHPVVTQVLRDEAYAKFPGARSAGVEVALEADPAAPIVVCAARAVLRPEEPLGREQQQIDILDHLVAGLTAANARERVRFLAGKLRVAVRQPLALYTGDITSLRAEVRSDHEVAIVLAHYLVAAVQRCRALGVSTADPRGWIGDIPGAVGERIRCQLLVDATDVPLREKIDHVIARLGSTLVTGDDRDLVNAVLADEPAGSDLDRWRVALGTPSRLDEPLTGESIPSEWVRAWQWSAVLPEMFVREWREVIRQVNEHFGEMSAELFDARPDRVHVLSVQTPYSAEELASLDVVDAARLVSSWRPGQADARSLGGAQALAQTLRTVVVGDARRWTENPSEVISLLREPAYVQRYLEALGEKASDLVDRTGQVLEAVAALAIDTREPAMPAAAGPDPLGHGWTDLDAASQQLVAALANAEGEIGSQFECAWNRAVAAIHNRPQELEPPDLPDDQYALARALNRPWGIAVQTILALARWEAAHTGPVHPRFATLLDELLTVPGDAGREFRAILADRRALLEHLVPAWLDDRSDALFRAGELGQATLDLTIRHAQPTHWLLSELREEILASAMRQAPNALTHVLIGLLNAVPGYSVDVLLRHLRTNETVLRAAIEEVPFLVQALEPGSPQLAVAVEFWQTLLDADRQVVPAHVLDAAGRWAFVAGLSDEEWVELTLRTVRLTEGVIKPASKVADRCAANPPDRAALSLLTLMIDRGSPWERSLVQDRALTVLRASVGQGLEPEFTTLRTRLLELGRHEAATIIEAPPVDE